MSVFTMCDYEKGRQIQAILFEIGTDLKTIFKLEEIELKYQKKQIGNLWPLGQRYKILNNGAPGVSLYPDFAVEQVLCEMMGEMHHYVRNIHLSNQKIEDSINTLAPLYLKLDKIVQSIDWSVKSGPVKGDEIFKPLACYIQTVRDLRTTFRKNAVERKVLEEMLDIHYGVTIEAYQEALNVPEGYHDTFARAICFTELIYPK